jgi:hypothetical protein
MSADIIDTSNRVLTWRITGQLKHSEFVAAQTRAADLIRQHGEVRFLVLIENLTGIDKAGDWGDVSFQAEHDSSIEKFAIVGDKKWEDVVFLFTGKGVRRVPIEFFLPGDLAKAKAWLAA